MMMEMGMRLRFHPTRSDKGIDSGMIVNVHGLVMMNVDHHGRFFSLLEKN